MKKKGKRGKPAEKQERRQATKSATKELSNSKLSNKLHSESMMVSFDGYKIPAYSISLRLVFFCRFEMWSIIKLSATFWLFLM